MKSVTLDKNSLKLEVLPEGQELIRDIIQLTNKSNLDTTKPSSEDLAVIVGDALMYYKILLEHKSKGGDVKLIRDGVEVNLPVVATVSQ